MPVDLIGRSNVFHGHAKLSYPYPPLVCCELAINSFDSNFSSLLPSFCKTWRPPPLTQTHSCTNPRLQSRKVNDHRYPYAVSLQYHGEHYCGGALIAPDVVITAGHCNGGDVGGGDHFIGAFLGAAFSAAYSAVVGRLDLDHRWEGDSIEMREEVHHPLYDEDTVNNDFGLVFLSRPVDWEGAAYVQLNTDPTVPAGRGGPSRPDEPRGDPLTVVGWGDVDPRPGDRYQTRPDGLRETTVYAMTNGACEDAEGPVYESEWSVPILTDLGGGISRNMLCAWAEDADACQVRRRGGGWGGARRLRDPCAATEFRENAWTGLGVSHHFLFEETRLN